MLDLEYIEIKDSFNELPKGPKLGPHYRNWWFLFLHNLNPWGGQKILLGGHLCPPQGCNPNNIFDQYENLSPLQGGHKKNPKCPPQRGYIPPYKPQKRALCPLNVPKLLLNNFLICWRMVLDFRMSIYRFNRNRQVHTYKSIDEDIWNL